MDVDVYGVLTEGYLKERFEEVEGICRLTLKAKIDGGVFREIIDNFVKSPKNIRSFLEINNSPTAEVSKTLEKPYDNRIMDSIVQKRNRSLTDLLNGNSKLIHQEAVSTGRSVPLVVLEMVFAIREYIEDRHPKCLVADGGMWVQYPQEYKHIT